MQIHCIISDPPPAGKGRVTKSQTWEARYLAAYHACVSARRRACEAEVDFSVGRGPHEAAERLRAIADAAGAVLLCVARSRPTCCIGEVA